MLDAALEYAGNHQHQYLASLLELLSFPSISGSPEHQSDMEQAAAWLATYLRDMGMFHVEMMPTGGPPAVYGEWLGGPAGSPTLLAYGHYDVQPVDPLAQWHTPPFEPAVRGDNLFARGASDDKGQLFAILAAAKAYLEAAEGLPINLKVLFEGEEELSSPHMARFLRAHRDLLAADAVLICDEAVLDPETPLILYGVRGSVYIEVVVRGPATDLHSGTFGGAVDNPFNVLVRLLAQLQDAQTRRIRIPGFYDDVLPLSDAERVLLGRVPITDAMAQAMTGVPQLIGEEGYSTIERVSVRPTLDIHGLRGGYTGEGKKTVIPSWAAAKLSMRLVPEQNPDEIARLIESYLRSLAPSTVALEFRVLGRSRPAIIDFQAVPIEAMALAFEQTFGSRPAFLRGGGSEPVVREFQDVLGVPIVLIGFGLPDDNIHAPNEKYHLPTFYRGIDTLIHYFSILAHTGVH